jgi:hypothetical protein
LTDGGKGIREPAVAAALWMRWEVIAEEFIPVPIKHRDKNST